MTGNYRKIIELLVAFATVTACVIAMTCAAAEPAFAAIETAPVQVDFPADESASYDLTGEFSATSLIYEYTISLPESGRLSVSLSNEMDDGVKYTLRDGSDLSRLAHGTLIAGAGDSGTLTFDLAQTSYILTIEKALEQDKILNTGSYTLHLSFDPAGEQYESSLNSNNTIAQAGKSPAIPFGTNVRGQLALNDDIDVYKVTLPKDGRLKAAFSPDLEGMDVWLYDGSDTDVRLARDDAVLKGNTTLSYDLLAGDYYLMVRRHDYLDYNGKTISHPTGTFTFRLAFSPASETFTGKDDTIKQVSGRKAMSLCTTIKGQLALNDDIDYYKLYIPKAGRYYIRTTSQTQRIQLDVYDSSKTLIRNTAREGKFTYNTALPKGTVYIAYSRAKVPDTGQYSFRVYPVGVRLASIRSSSKSFTARWGKGTGSGYQLQYSTDRKFRKGVKTITIKKRSTIKKTVKGLRSGKTYYVRIRSYVKQGSKKYKSPWSSVRGVIIR